MHQTCKFVKIENISCHEVSDLFRQKIEVSVFLYFFFYLFEVTVHELQNSPAVFYVTKFQIYFANES